jgi:type I restriction enzyme M protein
LVPRRASNFLLHRLERPTQPLRHVQEANWSSKNPKGRRRAYDYDELFARDKASLDIFWLKDDSLEASDNLPNPGVIAQEIFDDIEARLNNSA